MRPDAVVHEGEQNQVSAPGRSASENTWELHEGGTSDSDISILLDSLYARVLPITESLKALKNEGCKIILRIILYLSANDQQGADFVIGRPLVEWLDAVGADFVDVDQYII
jgi:hypothetical protein